jgi:curved DNA-binding protein CbpA
MEVLGFTAGSDLGRDDVQRRFRRLLRLAHPDHGAESVGAADRIAELSEARALLLDAVST